MFKKYKHARACIFVAFCSAIGTLSAASNVSVSSPDASVPPSGYQSTFGTYQPITENATTPDKSWRAANDAVAAAPMGGMQMGGGAMTMPMSGSKGMSMDKSAEQGMSMTMPMDKGMVMPAEKTPVRKKTTTAPMKMPMKKGMSMEDMSMDKEMVMPAAKQPKSKKSESKAMKMPMGKGMSMEGMSMPMDDKMPSMDMHKGMSK